MTQIVDWADRALAHINPEFVWVSLQVWIWAIIIALAVTVPYHLVALVMWLR